MLQEGHRLKAWGFLGTGTGAELLQPGEPRKPVFAFRVASPAETQVLLPRHPVGEEGEEEGKTKWKPLGLGGASCGCPKQKKKKKELLKWEEFRRKQKPPQIIAFLIRGLTPKVKAWQINANSQVREMQIAKFAKCK
jgi:hypothetical protein